jgi:hypothetical protein
MSDSAKLDKILEALASVGKRWFHPHFMRCFTRVISSSIEFSLTCYQSRHSRIQSWGPLLSCRRVICWWCRRSTLRYWCAFPSCVAEFGVFLSPICSLRRVDHRVLASSHCSSPGHQECRLTSNLASHLIPIKFNQDLSSKPRCFPKHSPNSAEWW